MSKNEKAGNIRLVFTLSMMNQVFMRLLSAVHGLLL